MPDGLTVSDHVPDNKTVRLTRAQREAVQNNPILAYIMGDKQARRNFRTGKATKKDYERYRGLTRHLEGALKTANAAKAKEYIKNLDIGRGEKQKLRNVVDKVSNVRGLQTRIHNSVGTVSDVGARAITRRQTARTNAAEEAKKKAKK